MMIINGALSQSNQTNESQANKNSEQLNRIKSEIGEN